MVKLLSVQLRRTGALVLRMGRLSVKKWGCLFKWVCRWVCLGWERCIVWGWSLWFSVNIQDATKIVVDVRNYHKIQGKHLQRRCSQDDGRWGDIWVYAWCKLFHPWIFHEGNVIRFSCFCLHAWDACNCIFILRLSFTGIFGAGRYRLFWRLLWRWLIDVESGCYR